MYKVKEGHATQITYILPIPVYLHNRNLYSTNYKICSSVTFLTNFFHFTYSPIPVYLKIDFCFLQIKKKKICHISPTILLIKINKYLYKKHLAITIVLSYIAIVDIRTKFITTLVECTAIRLLYKTVT